MRTVSSEYKQKISTLGRQLYSKIIYTINNEEIELGPENLNSITPTFEGSLLKSVMKELEIDSKQYIAPGTILKYIFGLKVDKYIETTDTQFQANKDYYINSDDEYILLIEGTDYEVGDTISGTVYNFQEWEYIDFGNYVVDKVEKQENTYSWLITCYDKIIYSMKDYEELPVQYPITIRDYTIALCNKLGLTFANSTDEFCNYDKEIQKDLFVSQDGGSLGNTYRDVLDQLAEVTGSVICINNNDQLEIRYPYETNDTIDEHFFKSINVKFGKKFGPVNSIVLTRAGDSDSIYLQDDESVEENGLCEIKISENQFMNFNDRDTYLTDLLETLDGLEFYINDFSSTGITYYELYDIYNINIGETTYKCLMLNDTIEIRSGLSEDIFTDMPEYTNTDYKKSDKTDNKINQTWIIANKQTGEIEALTSRVTQIETTTGDTYTKEQVNDLIQTAETGLTNKFITNGGNNLFRNTGLWFEDKSGVEYLYPTNDLYPSDDLYLKAEPYYEYWTGKAKRVKEEKASNQIGILLQNSLLEQKQQVRNGVYTISFKYKHNLPAANSNVIINNVQYALDGEDDTEFIQTINVENQFIDLYFSCDADDGFIIYDLMVNSGEEKSEYSQNENETTTDTVNISKGITITSSDTNTTFKADSDGIRVFNSRDLQTPITDFTDIGMETKKATIKDEATIVDLLFQKIGNNTWITKL